MLTVLITAENPQDLQTEIDSFNDGKTFSSYAVINFAQFSSKVMVLIIYKLV